MKRGTITRKTALLRMGISRSGPMKRGDVIRQPMPRKVIAVHGVKHYPDGREVCDKTHAGRMEYNRRKEVMWKRQRGLCGLRISLQCPVLITLEQSTFEHQDGRGMNGAHRDDRIEIDGQEYNLAVCWFCNQEKGSRRL